MMNCAKFYWVYIGYSNYELRKVIGSMIFNFFYIYLFVSRHEVHSMNTHTLRNAGR